MPKVLYGATDSSEEIDCVQLAEGAVILLTFHIPAANDGCLLSAVFYAQHGSAGQLVCSEWKIVNDKFSNEKL